MNREQLLALIQTDATVACSALLGLYARQTQDEQEAQATGHDNGQGFNGTDAGILSSFAEQVIRNREAKKQGKGFPTDLSPKQLALLRQKIVKYGRQLEEIAAEKAAAKAAASAREVIKPVNIADLPDYQEENRLPVVNGFDVPINPMTGNPYPSALVDIPGGFRWATDKEMAARVGANLRTGLTPKMIEQLDEFELSLGQAPDTGVEDVSNGKGK